MAYSLDNATLVLASGPRATRVIANADEIEPELVGFVRNAVRWIDPKFPQKGQRGQGVRGSYTDPTTEVETEMTQVEELAPDGRGIRIIRMIKIVTEGDPIEGVVRVVAVGVANGGQLELRWNFTATEWELRGGSAQLTVEGPRQEECIADFLSWFEQGGN